MRDAGPVIVITLALLLIGGIFFYAQKGSLGQVVGAILSPGPRSTSTPPPVEEKADTEKQKDGKPSPSRAKAQRAAQAGQAEIDIADGSQSDGIQQITVDVPVRQVVRFPDASDLSPGTERSAMIEHYGPSTVRTTTLEDGGLVELHVYLRKDPRLATYARLKNGKVISASTTTY